MPVFNRKNAKPPSASAESSIAEQALTADVAAGDLYALRLRDALAVGRWQETHDYLESVRDPRMRDFYVTALANMPGWPAWIDDWVAARPNSAVPLLFAGVQRTIWAWEARESMRANAATGDAWPVFQARLVQADRDLDRAAALDKTDPTPLAQSIWVAVGLSLGQAEIWRRFQATEQRQHLNHGACFAMIQATARKWGGSHEAMFEFARWASRESPQGSPAHKMIALAHIEAWLEAPREAMRGYFLDSRVNAEIRQAARLSIWSGQYPADPPTWADRNAFAFCFSLMKEHHEALRQMELIGTRVTPSPWRYQDGQPGKAYAAARQRALAAVYGS